MNASSLREPAIRVEQVAADWNRARESWNIGWRVENAASDPIRLLSVRLPHGQFKSDEMRFDPALDLAPGGQTQFAIEVRCNEPAGLVTENAFLIFQVSRHEEPWRLFVRVSVIVDQKGIPAANVESITTQRMGFSGVAS